MAGTKKSSKKLTEDHKKFIFENFVSPNIQQSNINSDNIFQRRVHLLQPKLGYKFKNIFFLHEALTHSLNGENDQGHLTDSNVKFKKRTFYRLKTVGVSVLKMVSCEYGLFVCHEDTNTTEGTLTKLCHSLTNNQVLKKVGQYLNLKEFVEINRKLLKHSNFQVESIYPDLVRSLFAAIFMDATRGATESGMECAFIIFLELWKKTNIFKEKEALIERLGKREYEDYFPSAPKKSAADLLRERFGSTPGFEIKEVDNLEGLLGHKFKQRHILEQALTDDSVKVYPEFQNVGHYQILEFIGDAIFELVICEYLYWHFINDTGGAHFNRKSIERFTQGKFQVLMAFHCGIINYIRKPPNVKVKDIHDYMEAVIGAIYVDTRNTRGVTFVKEYLYNICYRINCHAGVILEYELPLILRECHCFNADVRLENFQCLLYHSVEIESLEEFKLGWKDFALTEKQHLENLANAIKCEENLRAGILDESQEGLKKIRWMEEKRMPEYACNQLEFERVNVYRIAAREYLTPKNKSSKRGTIISGYLDGKMSVRSAEKTEMVNGYRFGWGRFLINLMLILVLIFVMSKILPVQQFLLK